MTNSRLKIVIVGAGQNSTVVANILSLKKGNKIIGFLDDVKKGKHILGPVKVYKKFIGRHSFFISFGDNRFRKNIFNQMKKAWAKFASAIHPTAAIEKNVVLGDNVMIGALSYININTVIGDNTFINNGCIIEHDNKIGSHNHITPGVVTAGEVTIKDGVFIGIGSTIRDRTVVAKNCFIGASSNVVANTEPNSMYYGNPAKLVKSYDV